MQTLEEKGNEIAVKFNEILSEFDTDLKVVEIRLLKADEVGQSRGVEKVYESDKYVAFKVTR